MPLALGLATLLAVTPVQAESATQADAAVCSEAMGIYLPERRTTPAPNIQLTHFQYMSPDVACASNVERDVLKTASSPLPPPLSPTARRASASWSATRSRQISQRSSRCRPPRRLQLKRGG